MAKFKVTEVTEIRSEFVIEAPDAKTAINKARSYQHVAVPQQSHESHYVAKQIEEEITHE